jgi:hypothetical protein
LSGRGWGTATPFRDGPDIEASNLRPEDLTHLEQLGISRELLVHAGVRRVSDQEAREILFVGGRSGHFGGVLFPYVLPWTGQCATYRVRRDHPDYENDRPKNKYFAVSGDRRRLYFGGADPSALLDTTISIVAVEAEKSVLAIASAAERAGRRVLPIGLGGCWGFRGRIGKVVNAAGERVDEVGVLLDFDQIKWTGRIVFIAVDSNAATNPSVQSARRALATELARRGATVRILDLPPEGGVNGPDDLIGRFGDRKFFELLDAAPDVATFDVVFEMNRKHAVVREGGRTVVITDDYDPALERRVWTRSSFHDFNNFYLPQRVQTGSNKTTGAPTYARLGPFWLEHPDRRQYEGVVMSPGRDVPGYLNLWQGFAVEPRPGRWPRLHQHIFEVICGADVAAFNYLMAWIAAAVQRPGQRAEVAIVLRGRRGVGKGHFVRSLGRLFGRHYLQISQPKHLVGHFNAHLQDAIVLFADEAFWAGDKQGEGVLKSLVTEEFIPIERKGRDVVVAKNLLHIILASNSEWVVPAGMDERRFLVLDVAPTHAQDTAYFSALHAEGDAGGDAALLHDLLHHDLGGVDLRRPPHTTALMDQKILSLPAEERWWFHKLMDGRLFTEAQGWEREVRRERLWDDYVLQLGKVGIQRKRTETELGIFLRRMVPTLNTARLGGDRVRHYVFPPLSECRAAFDDLLQSQMTWPPVGVD